MFALSPAQKARKALMSKTKAISLIGGTFQVSHTITPKIALACLTFLQRPHPIPDPRGRHTVSCCLLKMNFSLSFDNCCSETEHFHSRRNYFALWFGAGARPFQREQRRGQDLVRNSSPSSKASSLSSILAFCKRYDLHE